MKLTAAAAILVSCVPSLSFAQRIGSGWTFLNYPSGGLNDITFPFNIAKAPHQTGYQFTQEFYFQNVSESEFGTIGLQPRRDVKGKSIIQATFQSFLPGTTTKHANCNKGTDGVTSANGVASVSCAVEIDGNYSHTYNLVVENTKDTTWRGTLVDTVTHKSSVVGEWTLPKGTGKLVNGAGGYVNYYPWNNKPKVKCNTLPSTEVTVYGPTSKTKGASGGEIRIVIQFGLCVNEDAFSLKKVSNGYEIKLGF
ncbi:hypothetical protein EDD21DRAFT_307406 [Dissophora ornata]|nr:hypothetical protein BGZ58_009894 [Dissophora ornata]KAI8599863.1 hypothetical protein EDD21DRAFT_307406 [Dissophora ornata]